MRSHEHRHAPIVRQNWILDPLQDSLLVIAAPLIVLALAILTFRTFGAETATSLIISVHAVMTISHHLPTFIRIYGDVELFRRFRWTFLLAPVVPLTASAVVLTYLFQNALPVENFLYLFMMLVIWDPWHFLMQHYGFTRIYDRHNAAPKRLAARMDLMLSAIWFVFILLSAGDWLAGLVSDLFLTANLPLYAFVPSALVEIMVWISGGAVVAATLTYAGYLVWCHCNGWFISPAKLGLMATTIAALYFAYTPNEWVLTSAPGWTFKVGFAAIGIVHMTQYLAIVWRYNCTLARRADGSRPGWFRRLHGRGGVWAGAVYVLVCLGYGTSLSTRFDGRLLMSVLMALGFTSTLMHYYFDGFIWKLREPQNRKNLELDSSTHDQVLSAPTSRPGVVLLRQLTYFGVPMLILSIGAFTLWNSGSKHYSAFMVLAQRAYNGGAEAEALDEARRALAEMERELPLARRLVELVPDPGHEVALALLIHERARYAHRLLPRLTGETARPQEYRRDVLEAISLLQRALSGGGGNPAPSDRPHMGRDDMQRLIRQWRSELAKS